MKGKQATIIWLMSVGLLLVGIARDTLAQDKILKDEKSGKEFTVVTELWRTPAKSQGWTGTCWSFSTTSFFETEAYRLGRGEFDLSEIYTVYYAYLEKALRYVRLNGKANFSQGGLSHDLLYLIGKYGLVPESSYSGLGEDQPRHNHVVLSREATKLVDSVLENKKGISDEWIGNLKEILNTHIGGVPVIIEHDGREMTPQEFSSEVLALPFDDYIEFTSYTHMPFGKQCELLIPDNWMHYSGYYNVELDDFIRIVDFALEQGYSLTFDLDVSEPMFYLGYGYAVVPEDEEGTVVNQEMREKMFADLSTTDDHLEHCVGVAKDENGKKFYLLKDSGGQAVGPFEGHEFISENYVRAKVLAIMVHKDGVPQDILERLGID